MGLQLGRRTGEWGGVRRDRNKDVQSTSEFLFFFRGDGQFP